MWRCKIGLWGARSSPWREKEEELSASSCFISHFSVVKFTPPEAQVLTLPGRIIQQRGVHSASQNLRVWVSPSHKETVQLGEEPIKRKTNGGSRGNLKRRFVPNTRALSNWFLTTVLGDQYYYFLHCSIPVMVPCGQSGYPGQAAAAGEHSYHEDWEGRGWAWTVLWPQCIPKGMEVPGAAVTDALQPNQRPGDSRRHAAAVCSGPDSGRHPAGRWQHARHAHLPHRLLLMIKLRTCLQKKAEGGIHIDHLYYWMIKWVGEWNSTSYLPNQDTSHYAVLSHVKKILHLCFFSLT